MIAQIEEKNKKSRMFTCPNLACTKEFTKPLKAFNLQQSSENPYDACPYCLTEIVVNDEPVITCDENETFEQEPPEPENFEASEAPVEVEEVSPIEEKVEVEEKPAECAHYLGFLSERTPTDPIPDECIICKNIVACMLKRMKT